MLGKIKLDFQKMANALIECDETVLNINILDLICNILPSEENLSIC